MDGDIFLVTSYNKVGYWWGVSVYDLQRQGWFPSSFVQPYTGEVPDEARQFCEHIKAQDDHVAQTSHIDGVDASKQKIEYNIIANDDHKYQEYESVGVMSRTGRKITVGETGIEEDVMEKEDFDYDAWAKSKAEAAAASSKRSKHN